MILRPCRPAPGAELDRSSMHRPCRLKSPRCSGPPQDGPLHPAPPVAERDGSCGRVRAMSGSDRAVAGSGTPRGAGARFVPSRWRRSGVRLFFLSIVALQAFFIVRAYEDPHTHFGYQPFNESSTWRAEIWRVTADGRRLDVRSGWQYSWNDLVRDRVDHPFHVRHADSGVDSTLEFVQEALRWVADNTPEDRETLYLEAYVTYWRNTRGPVQRLFRSHEREEASR